MLATLNMMLKIYQISVKLLLDYGNYHSHHHKNLRVNAGLVKFRIPAMD
jgi:hypothetical protein